MVKIKHEVDNVQKLSLFLEISSLEKTLFQKAMHFLCVVKVK